MMEFITVLGIAAALSVDAMVVALCCSAVCRTVSAAHVLKFAFAFGLFQFLMPLAGGLVGNTVAEYVQAWDHWIAFALLTWVAVSMVKEGLEDGCDETCPLTDRIGWGRLFTLSVATSLDALAVGFSFAMSQFPILWPSVVIGIVCFILTGLCVMIGGRLSERVASHSNKLSFLGALVLFAIGVNVLFEHGVFEGLF
jgi:UPF0059 membrane protein gbem_1700